MSSHSSEALDFHAVQWGRRGVPSSARHESRRWTLYRKGDSGTWRLKPYTGAGSQELVKVMPVSEHETEVAAWVEMTRAAEAQAVDLIDELGASNERIVALDYEIGAARSNERAWREKAESNRRLIAERESELHRLREAAQAVVEACERVTIDTNRGYVGESIRALRDALNKEET